MANSLALTRDSSGTSDFSRNAGFRAWRAAILASGGLPVIAIAGSRGKTTVSRLVEAMLPPRTRFAVRSQHGVVIDGHVQVGEIEPWQRVEQMLKDDTLDVAIWEVDWTTARAVATASAFGVLAVTNVCANRASCLREFDVDSALASLQSLTQGLPDSGTLVLNGDDADATSFSEIPAQRIVLAGLSTDTPAMAEHWDQGGTRCWIDDKSLYLGDSGDFRQLMPTSNIPFSLHGEAAFLLSSGTIAASIATAIGMSDQEIVSALERYQSNLHHSPGLFNVADISGIRVIVDKPTPSWFLQPVVRAIRNIKVNRVLTVVGHMRDVPESDLEEVGRLIGRLSSIALLVTGRLADHHPWEQIRNGAAKNDFPPLIMSFATESSAFRKALALAAPSDVILVLTENPKSLEHFWPADHGSILAPALDPNGSARPHEAVG